jgi:hypothetical protein
MIGGFEVAEVTPLDHQGVSGSTLERVRTVDGRVLVVKTEHPEADWVARSTGDVGRVVRLWSTGVLRGLPASIDCAVEAVEEQPTGWRVVMRDVTTSLFSPSRLVSRGESRKVMAAVASMHRKFAGTSLDGFCPLIGRFSFLTPTVVGSIPSHPLGTVVAEGWARFPEVAPADVSRSLLALLEQPRALASALGEHPPTLLHGDLKVANMGLTGDRVVILDWGSLTGLGPPAVDHAWYLAINGAAIDASLDDLLSDAIGALRPEEREAVPLALVGGLLQLGWEKALGATSDDPALRARERAGLRWWCDRATEALDASSLL